MPKVELSEDTKFFLAEAVQAQGANPTVVPAVGPTPGESVKPAAQRVPKRDEFKGVQAQLAVQKARKAMRNAR
ncbi:hypothetical protein [Gryllotalpicola kribbensis]|uniref:hypothetical protein n=1 Tax=Gryllotalpicola kribbensis TaxID=993084 RepID=UPI0031D4AFFE